MRKRHDWQTLKLEFFQSDIDEVKSFLSQNWIKLNGWWIAIKTKNRWKEKQEYKNKVLQKALEKRAEDEAKALEIPMVELRKAKKAVLWILIKKVSQVIKDNDEINVYEQEKILNMIKRELWEPITIAKNDTTIREQPLNEEDFIDD